MKLGYSVSLIDGTSRNGCLQLFVFTEVQLFVFAQWSIEYQKPRLFAHDDATLN